MAKKVNVSLKHIQIDKANSAALIAIAAAIFVVVMSGFMVNALVSQRSYQRRVIIQKEEARDQLIANINAVESLGRSYSAFIAPEVNIIEGSSEGDGDRDGDNARLILDALPSSYDFPAFITSLEGLLNLENVTIQNITGRDEELSLRGSTESVPIEIPFSVNTSGGYSAIQNVIGSFERSIRPININQVNLSGQDDQLRVEINGHSYFQPEKVFKVETEVVR